MSGKIRVERCRWYYGGPYTPDGVWVVLNAPGGPRWFTSWREAVDFAFKRRTIWRPF